MTFESCGPGGRFKGLEPTYGLDCHYWSSGEISLLVPSRGKTWRGGGCWVTTRPITWPTCSSIGGYDAAHLLRAWASSDAITFCVFGDRKSAPNLSLNVASSGQSTHS